MRGEEESGTVRGVAGLSGPSRSWPIGRAARARLSGSSRRGQERSGRGRVSLDLVRDLSHPLSPPGPDGSRWPVRTHIYVELHRDKLVPLLCDKSWAAGGSNQLDITGQP